MGGYPSAALESLAINERNKRDPIADAGKMVALKGLLANQQQQEQMRPLELQQAQSQVQTQQLAQQEQQLKLQQAQEDQIDDKRLNDLWLQHGGDLSKVKAALPSAGVTLRGAQRWMQREAAVGKSINEMDESKLKATKEANAQLGPIAQSILDAPPEDQEALYALGLNKIKRDPTLAQYAQNLPPQYPGPDALKQTLAGMKTFEQLAKDREDKLKQQALEADAKNISEPQLFLQAQEPGERGAKARAAIELQTQQKRASRPITSVTAGTTEDAKDIADGIESGDQPPTVRGLYKLGGKVRAELARKGYPLAKAETDWNATQRFMSTMNGPQQLRMQQAVSNAADGLDKIEGLYNEWKQIAPVSGYKLLNKGALTAMANLPGRPGAVASNLLSQINDLSSEIGNVYMGGNTPTDHALTLGASNLKADWNDETFKEALKQIRSNLIIRRNSMINSQPAGMSGDTSYYHGGGAQPSTSGGTQQFHEGNKVYNIPADQVAEFKKDHPNAR